MREVSVNQRSVGQRSVAQDLKQPVLLMEHVFREFAASGFIKYAESIGGGLHMDVYWVSPELRRNLEREN